MSRSIPRALVAAFFLLALGLSALAALKPDRGLLDFGAFYMAGVSQEQGLDPYGVYPGLAEETGRDFGYTDGRGHSPNLNPPISLYPFRLLADANPARVMLALNLLSGVVFAACAIFLLRAYPDHRNLIGVLWLASIGGFWYTLWLGQIYVLLFALGLAAWLLIRRGSHPLAAGLLLGLLVAVKPHLILWPLFLLLAGHPRIGLTGLAIAAAISAIPLALEGPGLYEQWLAAAKDYPRIALAGNASLIGQAARLGFVEAGYAASAALVFASAIVMLRSRPAASRASSWAIVVSLLASPIAWIGYGLLAIPVLLARRWEAPEWIAAIGMTGIWFAAGLGEAVFAASVLLMYLLMKDQIGRRGLRYTLDAAPTFAPHSESSAA